MIPIEWKQHPTFTNYEISSTGQVRNIKTQRIIKEQMQKYRGGINNYRWVSLLLEGKTSGHYVHRLVATTFIPNPKNYATVHHKNTKRYDNRIENLEWMSFAKNLSISKSPYARYYRHVDDQGYAPLRFLRTETQGNLTDEELSKKYGVSEWFVQQLRRKQNANPWPPPAA